jgi:hypothetical protein
MKTDILMRALVTGSHPSIPGNKAALIVYEAALPPGPRDEERKVEFKVAEGSNLFALFKDFLIIIQLAFLIFQKLDHVELRTC